MKKFFQEPLVHFLLLGFLIFGLYYGLKKDNKSENAIVIDDNEYDYLLGLWKKQWNREPNEKDIKAFIDQYLRQEVYYKEALEMNLDHNDIIVKRRLAQKMEAVSNDLNAMLEPTTDEELEQYYKANINQFKLPSKYTFKQVLFLNEEPNLDQEIAKTKANLEQGGQIPTSRLSKLSIPNEWEQADQEYLYKSLGGTFYQTIDSLPIGKWTGPITSGFGRHLVYISNKDLAKEVDFEQIKSLVEQEYEYKKEFDMQEKMYRELMKKYPVKITSTKVPESVKKSIENED